MTTALNLNPELEQATDFLTKEAFDLLKPGEELQLNKGYYLYRYMEEDIYVIASSHTADEILQVLTNNDSFIFEIL